MADTSAQPIAAAPETAAPADSGETKCEANGKPHATSNGRERNSDRRGRGRGAFPKNGHKYAIVPLCHSIFPKPLLICSGIATTSSKTSPSQTTQPRYAHR